MTGQIRSWIPPRERHVRLARSDRVSWRVVTTWERVRQMGCYWSLFAGQSSFFCSFYHLRYVDHLFTLRALTRSQKLQCCIYVLTEFSSVLMRTMVRNLGLSRDIGDKHLPGSCFEEQKILGVRLMFANKNCCFVSFPNWSTARLYVNPWIEIHFWPCAGNPFLI